jgi:hypothetical protein
MTTGEVRELFAYDAWANALVFEAAAGLSEEQLAHSVASSFPSVVVKFRPKGASGFRVIGGQFGAISADQAPRF